MYYRSSAIQNSEEWVVVEINWITSIATISQIHILFFRGGKNHNTVAALW